MSLWIVYLAILLLTTAEGGMNTIVPPYLDAAHYGLELIGIITALFALLQLASRLPAGALYDRVRARWLVPACAALYALSTAGFGVLQCMPAILLLTVVHGFAFGALTTIMLPVAIQLRGGSQGARMGWYTASLAAGYALGAFLSGYLVDGYGYATTFVVMGLLPLGTMLLALALPPLGSPAATPAARRPRAELLSALPSLSPLLLFATLVAFYINFLDDGFSTFFPLLGLSLGLTLGLIGTLKGIKSATGVVVRVFAGSIFKVVNYRRLNHLLVIGWSLVVFALPWVREGWVFVALFVFMGVARSLSRVTSATLVAEEKAHDPSGIGLASGVYNMGLDAGALAGPLVAGFLARATDVPTMMRVVPFVMVALYFGALWWVNQRSAQVKVSVMKPEEVS